LIAHDGSDFANAILDDLRYAGLPPRAEVAVITLAEPEYSLIGKKTDGVVGWLSCSLIEARSSARCARERIRADFPGWDVNFEARLAPPPQEIVKKVAEWNPDLAIIGQHGRGRSKRAGLGRVAKRLFKEANCSVRIARARIRLPGASPRIVIPFAASQNFEATARVVASRLWPPRTEVKLVASLGPILGEMRLDSGVLDAQVEAVAEAVMDLQRPVERKLQSSNLLVTTEIMAGSPATDVIETARRWRADCVFMGAEELGFIERVFCGDFVASVASRAECSVEVVRGPVRCDVANFELPIAANHQGSLPVGRLTANIEECRD
jgi:nucleotide-binding universal stress UspA family protein